MPEKSKKAALRGKNDNSSEKVIHLTENELEKLVEKMVKKQLSHWKLKSKRGKLIWTNWLKVKIFLVINTIKWPMNIKVFWPKARKLNRRKMNCTKKVIAKNINQMNTNNTSADKMLNLYESHNWKRRCNSNYSASSWNIKCYISEEDISIAYKVPLKRGNSNLKNRRHLHQSLRVSCPDIKETRCLQKRFNAKHISNFLVNQMNYLFYQRKFIARETFILACQTKS